MPTPSDPSHARDWAAQSVAPQRSVFGNYGVQALSPTREVTSGSHAAETSTSDPNRVAPDPAPEAHSLQCRIHQALARSFVYRFLANAYEDPSSDSWQWQTAPDTVVALRAATRLLGGTVDIAARNLHQRQESEDFESFLGGYLAAFGHAARGSCPLNEIEYGDIKADPLFQPHRLADLAAFYRAFGMEVASDAGERHDHLGLELEFLCVLAAKDAYALEYQLDDDDHALCREAQKKFLREHLGRWTPAFSRRLAAATSNPTLRSLAEFTRAFVESECKGFGVSSGSEELALRPVDEAADRMCDACGLRNLPPSA